MRDLFSGEYLREIGIKKSMETANKFHGQWTEKAYQFLIYYLEDHNEFMVEDIRQAAIGIIPDPPSNRAWGGIVVRARKEKKIKRIGYRKVKNPKAHCTPAAVWQKL